MRVGKTTRGFEGVMDGNGQRCGGGDGRYRNGIIMMARTEDESRAKKRTGVKECWMGRDGGVAWVTIDVRKGE